MGVGGFVDVVIVVQLMNVPSRVLHGYINYSSLIIMKQNSNVHYVD